MPEHDHTPAGVEVEAAPVQVVPVVTPAWWTAPVPPDDVLEHPDVRGVTGWRNLGARRWAGVLPNVFNPDLLLLCNAAGTGYMRFALCLEDEGPNAGWLTDRTFDEMQARLDDEALPECVAPGCTAKGVCLMAAAEFGRLAGRPVAAGDEIRMCSPHAYDVYRAGDGLEQIAAWLRPDAEVLDPERRMAGRYDGFSDEHIHRTRARLPRMFHPGMPS